MNTVTASGESANGGGSNGATNLNNSTTSAHLNVYKPTFIINNSYQPGEQVKENEAVAGKEGSAVAEQQQTQQTHSRSAHTGERER